MPSDASVLSISRLEASVDLLLNSNFDADTTVFLKTLLTLVDNLLLKPYESKVRQLRLNNTAIQNKLLSRKGGLEVLLACGFTQQTIAPPLLNKVIDGNGEQVLVYPHEDLSFLRSARRMTVTRLIKDLGVSKDQVPVEPPKIAVNSSSANQTNIVAPFNVYSGHRYDAASAALGMQVTPDSQYVSRTEVELKALSQKKEQLERQLQPSVIDRQWKITRPGDSVASTVDTVHTRVDSLNASSGKSDLGLLAARMQKQQMMRLRQDAGFTTRAMREIDRLQTMRVYSHAVLTLQFNDGFKITGCFLPNETLSQVQQTIKDQCFSEPLDFDLIATPPRRILNPEQTLQQEGLAPAAKIVVSWKHPPKCQRNPGWYLQAGLGKIIENSTSNAYTFPDSKPVVDTQAEDSSSKVPQIVAASGDQSPTVESREDALLRRMMGDERKRGASGAANKWFKR